MEVSLENSLSWTAFETSNVNLWEAVALDINDFLTDYWLNGTLQGSSAEQAFSVQIDAANNTPDDQRDGTLIINIRLAPQVPAQFVMLRIQALTQPL